MRMIRSAVAALFLASLACNAALAQQTPATTPSSQANGTTNAPVAPGTATATFAQMIGCLAYTAAATFTAGQQGAVPCDIHGALYVDVNNTPTVYLGSTAAGAAPLSRYINAASSAMATNVKSTTGTLYYAEVCNSNATAVYFRLFTISTAPTVGTSTPALTTIIPATGCHNLTISALGLAMVGGIAFDVTTGSLADTDTTTIATASTVTVSVAVR